MSRASSPIHSHELVSLVHHVELNTSGWMSQAIERLTVAALWFVEPASTADVTALLLDGFERRLDEETIERILIKAENTGQVIHLSDGRFKVAEATSASFRSDLENIQLAESQVKASFLARAADVGLEVDGNELWDDFEGLFLEPLARHLGATLYELLTTSAEPIQDFHTYAEIISPMCDKYGPLTQDLITNFLEPSDVAVRSYILAHLNVCYLREAIGLDPSVIVRLDESRGRPDEARIFLDTNFVFSFLGIDEHPAHQLASELRELVNTVQSSIKLSLYVLPDTVSEARRVLAGVANGLRGFRATGNLATAASMLDSQGLVAGYFTAASTHPGLSPEEFFGRYEKNLVTLLRDRGVELFNFDTSPLHVDREVVDDVNSISLYQKLRGGQPKRKNANLHDMVLWHFVRRRRPQTMDSPIDASNWICTLDYGLIGFDHRKRKGQYDLPICLTPAGLIQLIQFWVPRSEALDSALLGSMRQPLLFLRFDADTEEATVKILKSMSRLRGVEGLSVNTTFRVLTNEALRARIQPATSETQMLQLVESAVIAEAAELERRVTELENSNSMSAGEQLVAAEQEAQRLRDVASSAGSEVVVLEARVAELRDQLRATGESAAADQSAVTAERDELLGRLKILESDTERQRRHREVGLVWRQALGMLAAAGVLCVGISYVLILAWKVAWLSWGCGATAALLLALLGIEWLLGRREIFRDLPTHAWVKRTRRGFQAALVLLVLSVIAGLAVNSFGHHPKQ